MIFDLIFLAGFSENDALMCEGEGVTKKSFLNLGDKTFIEHLVENMLSLKGLRDIYLSGMAKKEWKTDLPVIFVEDKGDIISKLRKHRIDYYSDKEEPDYVIVISSDTPLVTAQAVERFIERCKETTGGELTGLYYMSLIDQKDMEAKFPGSNRSYAKFRDVTFASGDTLLAKPSIIDTHGDVLDRMVNNRKSVFKSLAVVSPIFAIKAMLGLASLNDLNNAINKKIFKTPNACIGVIVDDPELGMDVDKPFQLEVVREYYKKKKL
ncbi:MAG: NTP transferase domain-containing protein [Candidatus Heimdallarchaeota archaeon]|nr:NTP transferase domain-containing protein [Candidatus Heimdallarchaeota archaeon]